MIGMIQQTKKNYHTTDNINAQIQFIAWIYGHGGRRRPSLVREGIAEVCGGAWFSVVADVGNKMVKLVDCKYNRESPLTVNRIILSVFL